ncbi:phosphoribosylformylglycinamidine cyclo-ligase [Methanoplanus sp. FWC-SCC4]|uniref:Phosphoribosylformylglycinamidine cyclo-ligase n=1 Tax=Methanochimaera problematica TaxID=2609417 RepID=A0AA97FA97_9EURY|nr:phosphoribosylformylglycinamidine cyclo-ligase [Methanoplanus sp. FWC-SCC4]WOF15207.1 phosphoribosylformylglycinamidine cyclo-ligase [Methanoplanus sp. FWC-SCC4]
MTGFFKTGGHTYRDAGVDIDLEAEGVKTLVNMLTYRRKGDFSMCSDVGHFAGLIEFGDYVLALAVDGVGTKMLVADRMENWSTLGIDCIAMNVNDLYVMNMEPVAFVDYIATEGVEIDKMRQIGEGLNEGARLSNMNLIGGETATLKGIVNGLDLAGTCLGVQKKDRIINGEKIVPGDVIIGVPSSGIHSNGLTLARKLVESYASYDDMMPWGKTLGDELLTPTRIYSEVLEVTAQCEVHGMCHITGGGLRNLKRLGKFGFDITDPNKPQPVYEWMEEVGEVAEDEMYRTFNMGMGYVFVVPEIEADCLLEIVPDAQVVGKIKAEEGIWLRGKEII